MTARIARGIVLAASPGVALCTFRTRLITERVYKVSYAACGYRTIRPVVVQGERITLQFQDISASADYSAATEITVDAWQGGINGTSVISESLTGGGVTLADDRTIQVTLTSTETAALTAGAHWWEVWVTSSVSDPNLVGAGMGRVADTRKYD